MADGKLYVTGGDKQWLWVLAPGRELKVLGQIRLRDAIYTSPMAANGVLYVMTNRHLYAVGR